MTKDDKKRIEEIRKTCAAFDFLLAQLDEAHAALRDTARLVRIGIEAGHGEDEAIRHIEAVLTYDPMVDCHKLDQYFRDKLQPFLRARKALGDE